jgi:hypothetical protein
VLNRAVPPTRAGKQLQFLETSATNGLLLSLYAFIHAD